MIVGTKIIFILF